MGYIQNYIKRSTQDTEIDGKPCQIEEFNIRVVGKFDLDKLLREKYGDNYISHEINIKPNPGTPEIYPEYEYFPETCKQTACSWIIKGRLYLKL